MTTDNWNAIKFYTLTATVLNLLLLAVVLLVLAGSCGQVAHADTVAAVIAAEACDQGPVGMAAVAHVINNRAVNQGRTPLEIVMARNQFYGYTASNKERLYRECREIADTLALRLKEGTLGPDITQGAEYFLLPGERVRAWHGAKTVKIKKHTFYRGAK